MSYSSLDYWREGNEIDPLWDGCGCFGNEPTHVLKSFCNIMISIEWMWCGIFSFFLHFPWPILSVWAILCALELLETWWFYHDVTVFRLWRLLDLASSSGLSTHLAITVITYEATFLCKFRASRLVLISVSSGISIEGYIHVTFLAWCKYRDSYIS